MCYRSSHTLIISASERSRIAYTTASMQLQDQHIDEFISIYQKCYGVVLERAEAMDKSLKLCRLIELVSVEQDNENEYGNSKNR